MSLWVLKEKYVFPKITQPSARFKLRSPHSQSTLQPRNLAKIFLIWPQSILSTKESSRKGESNTVQNRGKWSGLAPPLWTFMRAYCKARKKGNSDVPGRPQESNWEWKDSSEQPAVKMIDNENKSHAGAVEALRSPLLRLAPSRLVTGHQAQSADPAQRRSRGSGWDAGADLGQLGQLTWGASERI